MTDGRCLRKAREMGLLRRQSTGEMRLRKCRAYRFAPLAGFHNPPCLNAGYSGHPDYKLRWGTLAPLGAQDDQ